MSSHASGGRDRWSDPMVVPPDDEVGGLETVLMEVLDPEIPISIVDLGLVYGLRFENGTAHVDLTFTATACPCMDFIKEDISDRLLSETWIRAVEIHEVWNPPWTMERISSRGRELLKTLGVGV